MNKLILIFYLYSFCYTAFSQHLAASLSGGYSISSTREQNMFTGSYNVPILNNIHNGITAEYIFKTEQVGLGLELGYLKKGNQSIVGLNCVSLCFKIKRYYKNNVFFSMGLGYDRFMSYAINEMYLPKNTSNTLLLNPFDLFVQPSIGYIVYKNDYIKIIPMTGFDFSFLSLNTENSIPHHGVSRLYNRYYFFTINLQYQVKVN